MMQDTAQDRFNDLVKKEKGYSEKMESIEKILYSRFRSCINIEALHKSGELNTSVILIDGVIHWKLYDSLYVSKGYL